MKKYAILILTAVIFGLIGFIIGGITIGLRAEKNTQLASLVWINGLHEILESQRYDEARKMSLKAEKAHIDFLNTLQNNPDIIMLWFYPWVPTPPYEETLSKITEQYRKRHNESESLKKP